MKSNRATGFELMVSADGNLLQSAAFSRPSNDYQNAQDTRGWITRAVVLQVYYADEDDRTPWTAGSQQRAVLCDVRTYGRYSRVLSKVPVLQRTQGVWDEDIYIPRAAATNLEGGDVVAQPSGAKPPTAAENVDGDHVLVGFLDNDPSQPVVLPFVLAHPKSNQAMAAASGRVRRIRHNGTLVEWDDQGNLTLDATGAAKNALGTKGSEVSNSGTGGEILLKTKDGSARQTSVYLNNAGQILLGSDPGSPATEPAVLGNVLKALLEQTLDACSAITVIAGGDTSTVPLNSSTFQSIKGQLATANSDFIFLKKAH